MYCHGEALHHNEHILPCLLCWPFLRLTFALTVGRGATLAGRLSARLCTLFRFLNCISPVGLWIFYLHLTDSLYKVPLEQFILPSEFRHGVFPIVEVVDGSDLRLQRRFGTVKTRSQRGINIRVLHAVAKSRSGNQGVLFSVDTNADVVAHAGFVSLPLLASKAAAVYTVLNPFGRAVVPGRNDAVILYDDRAYLPAEAVGFLSHCDGDSHVVLMLGQFGHGALILRC